MDQEGKGWDKTSDRVSGHRTKMGAIGGSWTSRGVGFRFPQSPRLPGHGRAPRGRGRNLPTQKRAEGSRGRDLLGTSAQCSRLIAGHVAPSLAKPTFRTVGTISFVGKGNEETCISSKNRYIRVNITIYGGGVAPAGCRRVWEAAQTWVRLAGLVWQSGFQPGCRVLSANVVGMPTTCLSAQRTQHE